MSLGVGFVHPLPQPVEQGLYKHGLFQFFETLK
jgi:hypothetical protein